MGFKGSATVSICQQQFPHKLSDLLLLHHTYAMGNSTTVNEFRLADAREVSVEPLGQLNGKNHPTDEESAFAAEVKATEEWWSAPRWSTTKRPYSAEQICSKRGNLQIQYASNAMSKKLWHILEQRWGVGNATSIISST